MKKQKLIFILSSTLTGCYLVLQSFLSVQAQTICSNQVGPHGAFTFEYWKDSGDGCMVLGPNGTFSIEWSNINNLLARTGVRPGSVNQIITYSAIYNPVGNSYLCLYGWSRNPLVEYYIVESWGTWRPPGGVGHRGSFTSDGGTYDIYVTTRTNQPSIEGTRTFQQFWSVRRTKQTSGTITFANHVNAWASFGMHLGALHEVSFCVEGWQSSGNATITSLTMTTAGGGGTGSSYPVTVRARGVAGTEQIQLVVGGTTVETWTLTTAMANYTATTNATGDIEVRFINDITGRDVQVDHIIVNGITLQAEDQPVNTGLHAAGRCGGGSHNEWMHCNGNILFSSLLFTQVVPDPEIANADDFKVFPNPAAGVVNFYISSNTGSGFDAGIYNVTGTLKNKLHLVPGINKINTKGFEPGIYFIRANVNNSLVTRSVVIK